MHKKNGRQELTCQFPNLAFSETIIDDSHGANVTGHLAFRIRNNF